jgi:hypothetical protein
MSTTSGPSHFIYLHLYAGIQAYQSPSSNPPEALAFFCWGSVQLTRPPKGRHCSDYWPCHVCTFRDAGHILGLTLCRYQNGAVAEHFSTVGYLIPIMSILTVPVMPRARFLQNLLVTSVRLPPSSMVAIGLNLKPVTAIGLPSSGHIATCHVVCSPRPSQHHSYPACRQR